MLQGTTLHMLLVAAVIAAKSLMDGIVPSSTINTVTIVLKLIAVMVVVLLMRNAMMETTMTVMVVPTTARLSVVGIVQRERMPSHSVS